MANAEDDEKNKDPDFGLSSCSVVITAATPMLEEAEKPFPPPEEEAEDEPATEPVEKENAVEVPPPYTQVSGAPEKEEEDQHADSAPFPPSSSTGSEEDTYTGPSTAENSQSDKRKHDIPDELEPYQLARLQDLKESDA